MINTEYLNNLLDSTINKEIPGAVLGVSSVNGDQFVSARGNLNTESQFFIASATKLYTTALILQLIDSKKLKFEDKISRFIPADHLQGLHVIKGIEYSNQITIEHLLSHTSGLPDYFQAIRASKESLMNQILKGQDQKWDINRVISNSKELGALFSPSSGKSLYSDTNYQILGAIIENIYKNNLSDIIEVNICKKINLTKTYLFKDENDTRPSPLYYKKNVLNIPKAMTSFGPDGGVVSTTSDGLQFLKSFFEGELFQQSHIAYLTSTWRNIFFPLKYGVGISLFRLPWYFSPFKKIPDLIGHSGLSGAFLFYCPDKKLYLSGTVNQISQPQSSFRLMIKAILKS